MKKMMMLAVGLVMMSTMVTRAEGDGWMVSLDKAKQAAADQNRTIFAFFTGSDWCGWCKRLTSEVLVTEEFKAYAKDNLVLLTVDFPREKKLPEAEIKANAALVDQYKVEGFPTIVLLDSKGTELARTGYQQGGGAAYVEHLKKLLEGKGSAK